MEIPRKRAKIVDDEGSGNETVIFIAPQKINKMRLDKMKETAVKRGFKIAQEFSYDVTVVVTEVSSYSLVINNLNIDEQLWVKNHEIVNTSWFSESMKAGHATDILDRHRVTKEKVSAESVKKVDKEVMVLPDYACQRSALLKHHNDRFTNALETLELHAELRNDQSLKDHTRALAFRRASAVLKSLPRPLTSVTDLRGLKNIGSHAEGVIKEILDNGYSSEVETIIASEQFKTLKLFDGVFGIGPSTANSWYTQGHRSIEDIVKSTDALRKNDKRVQYGLAFYDELNTPVPRSEAEQIQDMVTSEAVRILPGTTVELTGGFRRGKVSGHDVDLLISHPENGKEKGLLAKLLSALREKNLILFGRHENHGAKMSKASSDNTMDDFEKWIGILKFPRNHPENKSEMDIHRPNTHNESGLNELMDVAKSERTWTARRVDLVVTPIEEYYYALVGWTGSKHFNRSLRLYAQRELNMKLTSRGLFQPGKIEGIPAYSERQVFQNIKLEYKEPWERNC